MTDDERFLQEFEERSWPLENWHHRDHVKLAFLYLQRYPFKSTAARIRSRIQAYSAANPVPDSLTSGYHEAMTIAWLHLIQAMPHEYGPAENADTFVEQHSELSEKKILRLFYSYDRIACPEAKTKFVEPDLTPLPCTRRSQR